MPAADPKHPQNMEELLRFYADAGHDEPLTEEPVDRFAEAARPAKAIAPQPDTVAS